MSKYSGLSNSEYWKVRSEERVSTYWDDTEKVGKRLGKEYQEAVSDIKGDIAELYAKYATDNNLDYAEAIRMLNTQELADYRVQMQNLLNKLTDITDPAILKEIELLKQANRLTRLQALENKIQARLLELGYTEQITTEDWLAESYKGNYYHTLHEVTTGLGFLVNFNLLNERAIQEAITYPWSGAMFSDAIWDNKRQLIKNMKKTIVQGLIKGQGYKNMAKELDKKMQSGYSNALRVIRTETAAVVNSATAKGYEDTEIVEKYVVIATLDTRTSSICQKQDSKVYLLKDRQIGVNYPPFHPNCRSNVAAFFEDELSEDDTRIARDADGKNIKVPRTMSYETWYKTYIQNT